MMKSVAELKGRHKDEIIFVIGSGASIDAYDADFFKGKTMVGVNDIYKRISVDFSIFTHRFYLLNAMGKTRCVASEIDPDPTGGVSNVIDSPHEYHLFKIGKHMEFEKNLEDMGKDDTFCLGNSIAILAINFAAYLGASSIILVGFDCCAVDGRINYSGYCPEKMFAQLKSEKTLELNRQYYNDMFLRNVKEISALAKRIREVYGCTMATLSPYVGLKNNGVLLKDYLTPADMERMATE